MSKENWKPIAMAEPAGYRIEVQGALDLSWADMFDGLRIEHKFGEGGGVITTIIGMVPDQAALAGVLNLTNMLGMPLVSVALLEIVEPPNGTIVAHHSG